MLLSVPTEFDANGEAGKSSAQAENARMSGDVGEARRLHLLAGEKLESEVGNKRKESEKGVIRFLAATQYYLGGHYRLTEKLCRHIKADLLEGHLHEIYARFLRDVRERAKPNCVKKMHETFVHHKKRGEYQHVLDLLKDHQYVIEDDGELAYIRGTCCERTGQYRAASFFFADAIRKSPDNPLIVYMSAASPILLLAEGKIDEGREYAHSHSEILVHPIATLAESIALFNQAVRTKDDHFRRSIHDEQVKLFLDCEVDFAKLPSAIQRLSDIRELMLQGFHQAALACRYMGKEVLYAGIMDRAILFASPSIAQPRTNTPTAVADSHCLAETLPERGDKDLVEDNLLRRQEKTFRNYSRRESAAFA